MAEERRRYDDKNWKEVINFISESREYRVADQITQKYQVENIEALKNAVKIQNGRIVKIEEWKSIIDEKMRQRKDNYANVQAWITVIATIIMAISAVAMIYIKV